MTITDVLRELWAGQTGAAIAAQLTSAGMDQVYEVKISSWRRGRVPTLDQLASIEAAHRLPRGWILWRAGYIDARALADDKTVVPLPVIVDTTQSMTELLSLVNRIREEMETIVGHPIE